ncbi:MAG: ABC transporter ATP-binding protein/permease [Bacilli bacterium]|nr:ABC transporter ATP-binding protein/permease [Bacilli bacterium]
MDLLVDKKMPIKTMFKRTWPYVKDEKKSFVSAFLLIILNVIAGVALPRLTGLYTDYIASSSPILSIIIIIACSTFILSCLSQAFLYIESMILTRAGQRIVYKLRMEVFSHIESMSQNQFNDMAVGSLVTRVCSYTSQLSEFFTNTLVHIIRESLTVIVTFVWMIVLSPILGGILAAVIVLIFIISIIFSTEIHKVFHKERKQISDINTYLNESLSGMKIVQIFNQERRFTKKFQDKNHEYFKTRYKITWLFSIYRPLVSLIYILTIALIIYSGSRIGLTAGTIVSFYLFLDYLFEPIQKLADEINHISRATTAMERLYNLLDIKPEVLNKDNSVVLDHIKGKIEFRHVYFAYEKENWILKDVSFVINPRETVAFVGATGAGKTTILGLIVRNFEIQRGQILIDDIDIRDIDINCLRTSIGQMLQDVFLFTGSIKDNITLFDNGYTDQEVNEAIDYVNAKDFVNNLPDKINTKIVKNGENFSTGQRQLLSFSRAVLHKPQIMILDEATANIDVETEVVIQSSLLKLKSIGTMLIVAHRLSTIQHADNIICLSHGEIVETGNHQELLKKRGYYYNLYKLQFENK